MMQSHFRGFFPFERDIVADFRAADYTEGAELVDAVLDVVRKEAEGTDCLQGGSAVLRDCDVMSRATRQPRY